MTVKTHQEPLPVLITLVLLLAAAGNVFVYVPRSSDAVRRAGTVLGVFPRHRATAWQR